MKWHFRKFCLGLIGAFVVTTTFAQENMTSLLKNADMEQGLKGWAFDGGRLMGKNTKNPMSRTGLYGMNNGVLEAWNGNGNGNGNGLADSYIMQRVGEGKLPNGTYVFGAYIGASKQGTQWENRDSVYGVTLFANESAVPVATENPDMNYKYAWAHSAKFNVAVTLTGDEACPGYLDLGLFYRSTNANYVVWDNATFYYFENMTEDEALDAMAKIDMENIVAIADTFVQKEIVMNADTLKDLKAAIKKAKGAETTAATLWKDSEDLFWQMGLARKSQSDYASLKKSLDFAKVVAEGVWRDVYKDFYYDNLTYAIEDAQFAYDDQEADRAELTKLRKDLDMYAGFMRLDSVDIALEALNTFLREGAFSNLPGEYTTDQQKGLQALANELNDTIGVVEAVGAVDPRPQDIYPYIERVYAAIEEVKNNPYDGVWLMTLPQASAALNGYKPLAGTELNTLNRYSYTSPLIEFKEPVELIRLTVSKVASEKQIYFCLSSLEFFDETGTEIELTAENFYSNADHNSVSGSKDGHSYEGLVDDKDDTYFHSDWSGKITEPHYLEVTLPNGGYTAVSFKMVARSANQNHQFPAEIVITTPVVKRGLTAVETALNDAKALNAYYGTDPGFYTKEFSALAAAMAQAEALLENYTSEEDCNNVVKALRAEITNFNNDYSEAYGLPDPEKTYRIVSAFPSFYEKQGVEKAITVHAADTTLWWETVCLDSLQQEFQFVPILNEDGEPYFELKEEGKDENGEPIMVLYYCYNLKNVKTGLYADSTFANSKIHLVEEATDTIRLKWLGRGQWNIMAKNGTFHTGDYNSGNVGGANGGYGGTWGVSSAIVPYGGGLDGASAWYIREMHAMPYEVAVAAGQFKSEYIHFEPSNTVTLTADKACAFDGLALYDLFGSVIAIDSLEVVGNTAVVALNEKIVVCSFAFNNSENVTSVNFSATTPKIQFLKEAYDAAVAVAPIEGAEVAQYSDLSVYKNAVAVAEALLANGGSDEDMVKAIDALEEAVEALEPNMPEAGKVYCIYSAVDFEANFGYKMALGAYDSNYIRWKNENALDLNQYWQFEPASVEQLKEAGMDTTKCAFYIKNLATKKYIGELNVTDGVTTALEYTVASAMPFAITILGVDTEVALDGLGQSGKRLHANGHGGGKGTGANIVYWGSGAGTASAWNIVEVEYELHSFVSPLDFYELNVFSNGNGSVSGGGMYPVNSEVTISAIPGEGYHFVEWSDGSTDNPYTFSLTEDRELWAVFQPNTYNAKFVVDSVVVFEEEVVYGERIYLPEEPSKEGYSFLGWDNEYYRMPAHDVIFKAVFSINSYQLSIVVNGREFDSYNLDYGTSIVLPDTIDIEGYTFKGWEGVYETMPAHDITISGVYTKNSYLVEFVIGDVVIKSDSLEYGAPIIVPDAPNLEGYVFCGWGDVAQYVPAHDVAYYGIYEVGIYKVCYLVNGKLVHIDNVAYGDPIPEYIYEPTTEGEVFVGWAGETYETMPAHDVTYTAIIETGIEQLVADNGDLNIYDLMGRKIQVESLRELTTGIYIINGKKVVVE